LFNTTAFALESLTVLQVSDTQKTIIINQGIYDNLYKGVEGAFISLPNKKLDQPATFIGTATLKQNFSNYSIWYFGEDLNKEILLTKGSKVYFLNKSKYLFKKFFSKYKKKVYFFNKSIPKAEKEAFVKDSNNADVNAQTLQSKEGQGVKTSQYLYSVEKKFKSDFDLPDVIIKDMKEFKEVNARPKYIGEKDDLDGSQLEFSLKNSSLNQNNLAKEEMKRYFENIVNKSIEQINSPDFVYEKLYGPQMKDVDVGIVNKNTDGFQESEASNKRLMDRYLEKIKQLKEFMGDRFSEEMSDVELSDYLKRVATEDEIKRQKKLVNMSEHNELVFGLGQTFSKPDILGVEVIKSYEYSFGFEYQLDHLDKSLQKYSLELGLLWNSGPVDLSTGATSVLGKHKTSSFYTMFYWYVVSPPFLLNTNLIYVGIGMSYGDSTLTNDSSGLSVNYSSSIMPLFKIGLKYKFISKIFPIGVKLEGVYAPQTFSQDISSSFPNLVDNNQIKFGAGLIYYF
jgi:hypothetical protein